MARPRTEDGFIMVALDLFAAIEGCGISDYARIVLAEVLMRSYGPRKEETIFTNGPDMGRLTGLNPKNASRAIRELQTAAILIPDGPGLRFNKDYESWKPPIGPIEDRLEGGLLAWVQGVIARLGPGKSRKRISEYRVSPEIPETASLVSIQTPAVSTEIPEVSSLVSIQTPKVPTLVSTEIPRISPPLEPPIGDRASRAGASEELREEEIRKESYSSVALNRDDENAGGNHQPGEPQYPDPETSFLMSMPGGHPIDESDARDIWKLLWKAFHSEKLNGQFYEHQSWHKADSWRAAIRKAAMTGQSIGSIRFIEKIAAEYDLRGVPVETPIVATGFGLQSPVPPQRPMSRIQERNAKLAAYEAQLDSQPEDEQDGTQMGRQADVVLRPHTPANPRPVPGARNGSMVRG